MDTPADVGSADDPVTAASAPARDASTTILVRDAEGGVEIFLLERVGSMEFAPGMTVFPGGGVDRSDAESHPDWTGPPVSWWAEQFGTDEGRARALVCAAVRETFEECGVLLAGPTADTVVEDTSQYALARQQLERREMSLSAFLIENELVLRGDLLRPWANWVTPVGEGRRYDTRFFVAALPRGQSADGQTTEAASTGWRSPANALSDWKAGRTDLLPPTWSQLTALADFARVEDIMTAPRDRSAISPVIYRHDEGFRVAFPDEDAYYADRPDPTARPGR